MNRNRINRFIKRLAKGTIQHLKFLPGRQYRRIVLFAGIMGLLILTGCGMDLESTDLSKIKLDKMTIGTSIDNKNFLKYSQSDRYSGSYDYKFEEIVIDVNADNEIIYLFARFDEDYINIKINGKRVKSIEKLKKILGTECQDSSYNHEQELRECIYQDKENHIKAQFVYSNSDGHLIWVTLNEYK